MEPSFTILNLPLSLFFITSHPSRILLSDSGEILYGTCNTPLSIVWIAGTLDVE